MKTNRTLLKKQVGKPGCKWVQNRVLTPFLGGKNGLVLKQYKKYFFPIEKCVCNFRNEFFTSPLQKKWWLNTVLYAFNVY